MIEIHKFILPVELTLDHGNSQFAFGIINQLAVPNIVWKHDQKRISPELTYRYTFPQNRERIKAFAVFQFQDLFQYGQSVRFVMGKDGAPDYNQRTERWDHQTSSRLGIGVSYNAGKHVYFLLQLIGGVQVTFAHAIKYNDDTAELLSDLKYRDETHALAGVFSGGVGFRF